MLFKKGPWKEKTIFVGSVFVADLRYALEYVGDFLLPFLMLVFSSVFSHALSGIGLNKLSDPLAKTGSEHLRDALYIASHPRIMDWFWDPLFYIRLCHDVANL